MAQTLPEDIVKYEDVDDLIKEGRHYQKELRELLKDVKVPVNKLNPHVLNSIRAIFGDSYITDKGTAYITFDMVVKCMEITKQVGKATAEELIR